MNSYFLVLGLVVMVVMFFMARNQSINRQETLLRAYLRALESGNKRAALDAGRAYYAFFHEGKLTLVDEQAIANDLSVM